MKKLYFILILLPLLGLVSCIKQKDCNCGHTGIWQYLEEPYYQKVTSGAEKKIVATITDSPSLGYPCFITVTGSLPKKYTTSSPIHVRVCVDFIGDTKNQPGGPPVFKLECIETID